MTVQEQIQQDVALVSENSHLQTQLFDFLKLLKSNLPLNRNLEKVLSHAESIDTDSAQEISKIVVEEFGKVDGEWQ